MSISSEGSFSDAEDGETIITEITEEEIDQEVEALLDGHPKDDATLKSKRKPVGYLHVTMARMYAGKTTRLLGILDSNRHGKALYINHAKDTRSQGPFSTHNSFLKCDAPMVFSGVLKKFYFTIGKCDLIKTPNLSDVTRTSFIEPYEKICIDEAHFFQDLVKEVLYLVEGLGKTVYVAGLKEDSKRRFFGHTHKLIPFADDVITIGESMCEKCPPDDPRKAITTHREIDITGEQEQIGSEEYSAVCRRCYLQLNPEVNSWEDL